MATRPRPRPDAWDSDYEVQSSEDDSAEDDVQDSDSDEAMAPAAFRTPRRARRRARPPPAPRKKRRGLVDESSDSSDDDEAPPPGYAYCAVCRRDVHADSFSAAVLRGDYGYDMTEPYCLAHSPQDLRDYKASGEGGASRLQTTTLGERRRRALSEDMAAADALDAVGGSSDDSGDSSDDAPPPPRLRRHADAASPRRRLDFDDVSDDEEEAKVEAECAICLAPIRDEEAFSTACAHQFHTACVAQQAAHDRAARRERGGVAQAQRCPLCRTPFPEVVAAAARGSSTELATRETADLRPGMNVEVQWELDGAPTWYRAKLVRHLGPHSRHTTINPNELPDRFLAARGFMMKYDGESEERGAWLASDGLLLDATEGISMHWRPARRRRRRVA